ncbi:MAG: hypothetical protein JXN59_00160, partial [Anaerolineae bacterium]|nr:hypothetical protein [Anaerolineae bacterium]
RQRYNHAHQCDSQPSPPALAVCLSLVAVDARHRAPVGEEGKLAMSRYLLLVLLLLLAACAPTVTPAPPTVEGAPGVEWDTRAEAIVFQLGTGGASRDRASDLNSVPYCTIYGDGHVIWLNPGITPEEFLETRLDEATLRAFLEELVYAGFYTWEPQQVGTPPGRGEGPPRERITLTLFGETRWLESPAGWPPGTFARLQERCRQFTDSPVLYMPTGAWISALPTTESASREYAWEGFAEVFGGVRLADIPLESPRWVTGEAAASAWRLVRRGRVLLTEDGQTYRWVVQVPGLQPESPPAPR